LKVNVDTSGLQAKFKELYTFIDLCHSKTIINRLGQFAIDRIYKRVKSGYGVSDDTSASPTQDRLKALSKSYVQFRKGKLLFFTNKKTGHRFAIQPGKKQSFAVPQLGEYGSPGRSNLTMTGQMLNNIGFSTTSKGFKIFIKDTQRASPVWEKGKQQLSNKTVAEHVSKERPFLALTTDEQLRLREEWLKEVRDLARQLNSILTRR
jgi:hypothetical protein